MPRVAIVEDDANARELILRTLRRAGFDCVCACITAEEALREIPACRPDVVLMDVKLPVMDGIECTARLRGAMPRLQIIMLTEHGGSERVFAALKAGANGYLLRSRVNARGLQEAIEEVLSGGAPMTPEIARFVVDFFHRNPGTGGTEKLSRRELEVLRHLAQGALYKEIADRLGITLDTVRCHIQNIYQKLQVRSRTEAVVKYLRNSHTDHRRDE
jgi:DNA-binding NarL/FixJ family response regulator